MRKIKLNERQILMLQKLQQEDSAQNKVLKITESQYNRLFKNKGKAVKKLEKSIKKAGMDENTKKINLADFAQEVIVFIKDILSKSDHRTMPYSPYWSDLGISKAQLFNLIKKHGLLALVDEQSEIREYAAPKHGFRKKVKELYNEISEWGDGGYPAGAANDPNAPWNQPDPEPEAQEEIIRIPEEQRKFKILHFGEDGMSIFKAGNELFVACLCDIGDINDEPEEWDGKIYRYDYQTQTDNITPQGLEDYINDMYNQKEIKPVRNDKTDKFPVPTLVTPTVKAKILQWYGKDPKMVQILNQVPESTGAASSGAYVAGASFGEPNKKAGIAPESAMSELINDDMNDYDPSKHLAELIDSAIQSVDESLSYDIFAKAVAHVVANSYGRHLYDKFLDTVVNSLADTLMGETTSTATVGAGVGANGPGTQTTPQYAYDAPAGDGKDFWTAGNKLNKKMGKDGTPIVRGGKMNEGQLFTESEQQFLANPHDKFRSGFDLDPLQQLFFEYSQIYNNAPARSIEEYEMMYKPRLEAKVLAAKAIQAEQAGQDPSLFKEEMDKRQQYLMALDQWKVVKLKSKNDPMRQKIKQDLLNKAKAIGINLQLEGKKVLKITQEQFNKIIESENMTKTAYPNGDMVDFDDCTKLNNNTKAQDGGCSQGAVDNVVKTKKTKGSVVAK